MNKLAFLSGKRGRAWNRFLMDCPDAYSQVAFLVAWFHCFFEDPAQTLPYDGRAGGYQYLWGGFYRADEVLGEAFGDYAAPNVIRCAVREIEAQGVHEWTPGPTHPETIACYGEFQSDEALPEQ